MHFHPSTIPPWHDKSHLSHWLIITSQIAIVALVLLPVLAIVFHSDQSPRYFPRLERNLHQIKLNPHLTLKRYLPSHTFPPPRTVWTDWVKNENFSKLCQHQTSPVACPVSSKQGKCSMKYVRSSFPTNSITISLEENFSAHDSIAIVVVVVVICLHCCNDLVLGVHHVHFFLCRPSVRPAIRVSSNGHPHRIVTLW